MGGREGEGSMPDLHIHNEILESAGNWVKGCAETARSLALSFEIQLAAGSYIFVTLATVHDEWFSGGDAKNGIW